MISCTELSLPNIQNTRETPFISLELLSQLIGVDSNSMRLINLSHRMHYPHPVHAPSSSNLGAYLVVLPRPIQARYSWRLTTYGSPLERWTGGVTVKPFKATTSLA